jgi:hypothetical protein
LKQWLQNRLTWLDANLPGTCYPGLSTGTLEKNKVALSAVPNPFGNELTLEISAPKAGTYNITMMSLDGKTVASTTLAAGAGKTVHALQTDTLAPGIYVIQVVTNDEVVSLKVVKQ